MPSSLGESDGWMPLPLKRTDGINIRSLSDIWIYGRCNNREIEFSRTGMEEIARMLPTTAKLAVLERFLSQQSLVCLWNSFLSAVKQYSPDWQPDYGFGAWLSYPCLRCSAGLMLIIRQSWEFFLLFVPIPAHFILPAITKARRPPAWRRSWRGRSTMLVGSHTSDYKPRYAKGAEKSRIIFSATVFLNAPLIPLITVVALTSAECRAVPLSLSPYSGMSVSASFWLLLSAPWCSAVMACNASAVLCSDQLDWMLFTPMVIRESKHSTLEIGWHREKQC